MRSAGSVRSMLVAIVVSACKLNDLEASFEPETGPGQVYTLAAINDQSVPVTLSQNNIVFEVQKGALTLATDSTWILSFIIRQQGSGASQRSVSTQRGKFRQPAQPTAQILLSASADSAVLFSGTYTPTTVNLTDALVPQGDRFRFTRP
jgi:hypothetical protein